MLKPSLLFLLLGGFLVAAWVRAEDAGALWSGGVQTLLDLQCVKCHGPLEQKSKLELDTVAGILKGSEDGEVVVRGKPEESKLFAALSAGADPHMPPKKQLSHEEIERVRAWITALGSVDSSETRSGRPVATPAEIPTEPTAAIDYYLAISWKDRKIVPTPPCDDPTFVRRVFLDLAGRIPLRPEVEEFLAMLDPQKREKLVDRLLASPDYAVCFRETWDALLMGRHAGRREQRRREHGWFGFLENAFEQNRPWDEVVRALIAARPHQTNDQGASWFLYERNNDHQQIAEALAPIIYGTRVDCAQCHNHPLAREIKQGHYWGLVVAFNRSKNVDGADGAISESAVGGFVNFTNLKKESQPALLALLTGETIPETRPAADSKPEDTPEGYIDASAKVKMPKFSRRAALAQAATQNNPLLARSMVNYTWAILLGRGIVHPVDEMNSKHPPSHPALLDWLGADFASHHYDVRRLVKAIVLSRAYQLSTNIGKNQSPPPPEVFAAAAERPLTAETIARSARIASGRAVDDAAFRQEIAEAFPDVLPRVIRTTIQQAMFLANNEHLAALFKPDPGTSAERLSVLPTVEERVQQAFRLALIREPDTAELAQGVEYLRSPVGQSASGVGKLLWALVTGPEFLSNH